MYKGKWDVRTDFKMVQIPLACYVSFLIYIIVTRKLNYISSISCRGNGTIYVGSQIFFYFQFVTSFFVITISSSMFQEFYRPQARLLIRTLPLSVHQIWTLRYMKLLIVLCLIMTPAILLGVNQVNVGIVHFIKTFDLKVENAYLNPGPIFLQCFVSANFILLLTQVTLIVTKYRMIACSFMFVYCILEAGIWGNFMGQYDAFYGCFSAFPLYATVPINFYATLAISIFLQILVFAWYKSNLCGYRDKSTSPKI